MAEKIKFDVKQARKDGATDTQIAEYLAKQANFNIVQARKDGANDTQIIDYLVGPPETPREAATSLGINPVPIVSSLAGAGVGALTKNPVAASASSAAVDKFLRYATGQEQYQDPETTALDIVGNTALNEVGGRILAAPFKIAKTAKSVANASVIDPLTHPFQAKEGIDFFKPTYAQLLRSKGSRYAGLANAFENLFAPASKTRALEASFEAAKDEGDKFIEKISGRKGISTTKPNEFARLIKEGEEQQFVKMKLESNARGEMAKIIADTNLEDIYADKIIEKTDKFTGYKIKSVVKEKIGSVRGPINYKNTIIAAKKLKDEMFGSSMKPDPENPVLRALDDLLTASDAKFDDAGNLISSKPISFGTAWKDKQISDAIAYGTPMTEATVKEGRFKQISNALNQDIEESIPLWKNNGDEALRLFQESKKIVALRHTLLNPTTETGKSIDTLINTVTKPTDTINTIIDDPEKLKRFLITGKIQIPNKAGFKYLANNARKDAQGYQVMRMLNEAQVPSPLDNTKQVFSPNKLNEMINDPLKQESFTYLFGSNGLKNVKELFRNIAMTSDKSTSIGASRYLGLKAGTYGISLGTGIATALTAGRITSGLISGGIGSTVTLGAHALARAMTNPEAAQVLLRISRGAPLEMSTQLATRIIANSIRGQAVTIDYGDGNSIDGVIGKDGKFSIPLN